MNNEIVNGVLEDDAVLAAEIAADAAAELTPLDLADVRLQLATLQANEARKAFVALLPEATVNHMAVILKATANGEAIPEGYQPGKYVRLTESQRAMVKKVADERKADLTANKEMYVKEASENGGDLVGYTIRVGAKATTTRLTFVKSHGTKPAAAKSQAQAVRQAYAAIAGEK